MANEQVTGTVIIRLDGRSIRTKKGATLKTGGIKRTPQFADGKLIGFTEEPVAAEVDCTIIHTATTDVTAVNDISDGTLLFECDSGPVYTIRGAFVTEPCEIKDGEGESKVMFAGQPAVQTS